ncbi:hypothetical protein QCA50_003810 [Cerrena zonata]|uniref:C2H2-type domain-containing protein n=1 Tax=Cerrena zonata TaxID=2478898 RepID=A0AAW0GQG1_9APHY
MKDSHSRIRLAANLHTTDRVVPTLYLGTGLGRTWRKHYFPYKKFYLLLRLTPLLHLDFDVELEHHPRVRISTMAFCERCDRNFSHYRSLRQHLDSSPSHHICYECDRDFTTANGLIQHYVQSSFHSYCQRCSKHFDNDNTLRTHYEDAHWYCPSCNRFFVNETGLHEHNRQSHWYCESCRRTFQNENNLNVHLRSSIHQPRRLKCPGRSCDATFVTEAHLVLHCESGTCPSGVTRQAVDRVVASIDRGNVITDPRRMIESSNSPVTQTWATGRSWNGEAYECFLCHKEYRSLSSLNQHLQSAAHQDKKYRCPPAWDGCNAQFKTLSGLMQHVESGSCDVERFRRRFTKVITDITDGMRMLTF